MPDTWIPLAVTLVVLTGVCAGAGRANAAAGDDTTTPVIPVPSVDLERYAGLWYEIGKIPNRFQKQCVRGTTAEYVLRDDGRIDVINRCIDDEGETVEARGIGRVVGATGSARLEVSFVSLLGLRLFWGDYWIIGLGEDYEYAIVGTPDRKYGWILARQPRLPAVRLTTIFEQLRSQGYDPGAFELSDAPD